MSTGHTDGTLLALVRRVGSAMRGTRRRVHVQLTLPLTSSTEIALGLTLRMPRPRHARGRRRQWIGVVSTAAVYVIAVAAPLATVAFGRELWHLASLVRPAATQVSYATEPEVARPFIHARGALVTVVSGDPPAVRAHVVAPGETLLSIAVDHGIAPQTLAYNNGIADTAQLRVGESLLVPPFDAAIHVVGDGESVESIAARFDVSPDAVRAANVRAFDGIDDTPGRWVLVPVPGGRYPGFRLRVSEDPRVFAPRVGWPADGVITQLFAPGHTGVDIAAPHGTPIVAGASGTVSSVGWRGPGGLAVCVHHDWGLETCAYHASEVVVDVGERVVAGQKIASVGSTGVSTGAHVHWEARTNGVLVDPMTYAPSTPTAIKVGGATGSP